ncbi:MAG: hypothetical protein ACLQU4_11075 [Limisphaerales bacterium]
MASLYQEHRRRGKKANTAITIVAHRLCRIVWQLLHEKGDFENRPFRAKLNYSPGAPV